MEIRRRIHFTGNDDLHLLREVLGQNPYENPLKWGLIQTNILQITGKLITIRAMKERIKNLVNKFLAQDKIERFKSGTEEEVTELNDLLKNISDLMKEFKNKIIRNNTNQESSYQKGLVQRDMATKNYLTEIPTATTTVPLEPEVENVEINDFDNEVEIANTTVMLEENTAQSQIINTEESTPKRVYSKSKKKATARKKKLTPTRKRPSTSLKHSTLSFLTKKNEQWNENRSREISLQESKQSLEEKKFELDSWEKRKRIEIEEKRLNTELDIFKNQQKLIEMAFHQCKCDCQKKNG